MWSVMMMVVMMSWWWWRSVTMRSRHMMMWAWRSWTSRTMSSSWATRSMSSGTSFSSSTRTSRSAFSSASWTHSFSPLVYLLSLHFIILKLHILCNEKCHSPPAYICGLFTKIVLITRQIFINAIVICRCFL